ncbi:MAG: hypothetical protein AAGF12_11410 [Myxococcota bacterium]
MARIAWFGCLAAVALGCGDDDASAPDALVGMDASRMDATVDAGTDGTMDATTDVMIDGPIFDPDGGIPDLCADGGMPGTACTDDTGCGAGQKCVPGGCNGMSYCTSGGSPCMTAADCGGAGTECVIEAGNSFGLCQLTGGGMDECLDRRTCPFGFACEEDGGGVNRCVDRRQPCPAPGGCPPGFSCFAVDGTAVPYCFRTLVFSCSSPMQCPENNCVDLFGDGDRRCFPAGNCSDHMMCGDRRCSTDSLTGTAACGAEGPCRVDDDCFTTDATCVDVHGDGQRTCQPPGGACTFDADCPPRALCWDRNRDGMPECVSN